LGLDIFPDPLADYRVFVFAPNRNQNIQMMLSGKIDDKIGELLGSKCSGHNYSDQNIDRISGRIFETNTGENIYSEVCESSKISIDEWSKSLELKVRKFDEAMKILD